MSRRMLSLIIALVTVVIVLLGLVGFLLYRMGQQSVQSQAADVPTSQRVQAGGAGSGTGPGAGTGEAIPESPGRESMERVARLTEGDPLAMGPLDAPVVMTVHSDFRCPFCAKFSREVEPVLIKEYVDTGKLRMEWRDLPIFGEESMVAARAARAAADQDRFWEFTQALYADAPASGHPDHTEADLVGYAREAGVADLDRFRRDMGSTKYDAEIKADQALSTSVGAKSTPTVVINGTGVVGARPVEVFTQVIEQALAG